MVKIVLLDKPRENPGELDWNSLTALGDCAIYDETPPELAAERIGDAEIVLLNKTPITRDTIRRCPKLKFISVIATGFNTVDVAYAAKKGILVSNVPSYGSEAISQHAIALLLELTNHVAHHDAEVRRGRKNRPNDWCFWDYSILELAGKTAGIIGLGHIGKITAQILLSFGMNVLAYDTCRDPGWETARCRYADLDALYRDSDVILLHCPLFEENRHMICRDSIRKMKNGVILINNSRGGLIVEQDLADALNSGKVAAAGLDTVEAEPIAMDSPLLQAKNCVITPHISWAALECRQRLQTTAIDNLRQYLAGSSVSLVQP
jgi:glycerate dehydrogenase